MCRMLKTTNHGCDFRAFKPFFRRLPMSTDLPDNASRRQDDIWGTGPRQSTDWVRRILLGVLILAALIMAVLITARLWKSTAQGQATDDPFVDEILKELKEIKIIVQGTQKDVRTVQGTLAVIGNALEEKNADTPPTLTVPAIPEQEEDAFQWVQPKKAAPKKQEPKTFSAPSEEEIVPKGNVIPNVEPKEPLDDSWAKASMPKAEPTHLRCTCGIVHPFSKGADSVARYLPCVDIYGNPVCQPESFGRMVQK